MLKPKWHICNAISKLKAHTTYRKAQKDTNELPLRKLLHAVEGRVLKSDGAIGKGSQLDKRPVI